MIPTQEMIKFPVFAENGKKIQPDTAKYSQGFQEADVLPAEWMNFLENKSSAAISTLNAGVSSIEEEINAVIDAGGMTPSVNDNSQLLKAIQYMLNKAVQTSALSAYPIGALYWSSDPKNPGEIFGGTWKQIKDKFILAAGDKHKVDETGGNETVTFTEKNLPNHTHRFTPSGSVSSSFSGYNQSGSINELLMKYDTSPNVNGVFCSLLGVPAGMFGLGFMYNIGVYNVDFAITPSGRVSSSFSGSTGTTASTGESNAFSIMPPYETKYCWERIA